MRDGVWRRRWRRVVMNMDDLGVGVDLIRPRSDGS